MHTITKFLITLLIIIAGSMGSAGQARLGRTTGMTQEEALLVAIECINKAAGFKAISDVRQMALNRVEDKLEYLGITDSNRLNALRRYLVRNEEIGTQRISVVHDLDVAHKRFYRYMITSHDLVGIKKDWTVLKLAQFIAEKAGISKMPINTARSIVADCRAYSDGSDPIDIPAVPAPVPLQLNSPIQSNLIGTPAQFAKCIVDDNRYGVESVKFDSTKGDALNYFIEITSGGISPLTKSQRDGYVLAFITNAVATGWTFDCLALFIAHHSQVSLPKNSLAGEIVMTAIFRNIATPKPEFHKQTKLGAILSPNRNSAGLTGLQGLISDIMANLNSLPINSGCKIPAANAGATAKRGSQINQPLRAGPVIPAGFAGIDANTTVEELIMIVRSNL